ncbi:AAA-like domain-containing protein [Aerosakkonema sp. BLCC-F183]|uniref:AAA-like domain-containing protein n=1 Tax=Aerosakkonema sp. BLCC-F183 TaxID=3342834 RepID=UPI0035B9C070
MDKTEFYLKLKTISPRRREILSELLKGTPDTEIKDKYEISLATVRKHVQEISEYFDIKSQPGRRRDRRLELRQLFAQHGMGIEPTPNLLSDTLTPEKISPREEASKNTKDIEPTLSGIIPLDSPFYVRRKGVDDVCEEELAKADTQNPVMLKLVGTKSMGKSSLLVRLRQFAEDNGHLVACVDLSSDILDREAFQDLEKFLQQFASVVVQKFSDCLGGEHLDNNLKKLDEQWQSKLAIGAKCTNYLESIFKKLNERESDKPKTLLIDGLDFIEKNQLKDQSKDKLEMEFFSLLKSWYETKMKKVRSDADIVWPSMLLAYSLEPQPDYNSSFAASFYNIGINIELRQFNLNEILSLAKTAFHLDWNEVDAKILMNFVGGYPRLVNWILYKVSQNQISLNDLDKLLDDANSKNEPVMKFLSDILREIRADKQLYEWMRNILKSNSKLGDKTMSKQKLIKAGIIKEKSLDEIAISCNLYRIFFERNLD